MEHNDILLELKQMTEDKLSSIKNNLSEEDYEYLFQQTLIDMANDRGYDIDLEDSSIKNPRC